MTVYKTMPNGVHIIEYDHSFAQALADMWNASGDSWGGDTTVRTASDIVSEMNGGHYLNVYLAEKDGEVLGFASLSKYYKDNHALYLHVLNVRPDLHGQKLGKALVLQCVERTIELGYPRLDIHTWPGNTKSVPLYKKCGYMWEDRVDSTHLVNFIPTVLNTEASKDFFATADWYADSTRIIEVKPDGQKLNGFEVFAYTWEKEGRSLAAGFERTGRRLRLLETDDYAVTLTAENHELAFGLDYHCTFEVLNKTGQPLTISIKGKNDGNIRFDYAAEAQVTDTQTFDAMFFVGEITEPQDIWQVHPCVLADVYINGRHAEFGMGIEAKWPVTLALEELKRMAAPGAVFDTYVNLTSHLRQDAQVTVTLPADEAAVTRYEWGTRTVSIPMQGKTSVKIKATALGYGHEALPVAYAVTLADGRALQFTRPLPVVSRGFTGACGFETETDYVIQNGPWQLGLNKNGAYSWTNHANNLPGGPGFPIGQLGRPYNDEFERVKPVRVDMRKEDDRMVLEAVYASPSHTGVEYASIYTLAAAGMFTRRHRVVNIGDLPVSLTLKDESNPWLSRRTILPYNGGVQTLYEGLSGAAICVEAALIDENWAYENDPSCPVGICWPPSYKLNVRWGDCFYFEHDINLAPGACFETEPVTVIHGQFKHYQEFRDYAKQVYTLATPVATPHIEWTLNGGNPFSEAPVWTASLHQHRSERFDGLVQVTADGQAFDEGEGRTFTYTPPAATAGTVTPVQIHMDLTSFEKTWARTLFKPRRDTDAAFEVRVAEQDGIFTASNGVITFKADPRFSDACYSLMKDGHEWLLSQYPSRAPYAWYNPFIGGLHSQLDHMNDAMTVRETIMAAYAEETDALGNIWKGLSTTVQVNEFDEHKGMSYTQYYLTLPGLPVLGYFIRLHNQTGLYKKLELQWEAFFGHPAGFDKLTVTGTDAGGTEYRFHAGADNRYRILNRLAVVEAEGRGDRCYLYRDTTGAQPMSFGIDTRLLSVSTQWPSETENGGTFTSKPTFVILTPETLTAEALTDLDRVIFA